MTLNETIGLLYLERGKIIKLTMPKRKKKDMLAWAANCSSSQWWWCCDVEHVHKLRNWKTLVFTYLLIIIIPSHISIHRLFRTHPTISSHHLRLILFYLLSFASHLIAWLTQYCWWRRMCYIVVNYILYLKPWFNDALSCLHYNALSLSLSHTLCLVFSIKVICALRYSKKRGE